jgi:hypothetical protein
METKVCQNCKGEFIIEKDDFGFYEKIGVPPPTFCPECRRQRRMAWRNDFTFYNRKCDMCGRNIISLYHKDKPLTVYCNKCWWSDKWDPKGYAKDFDFSRPFFEQFDELQRTVPILALMNDNNIGSINCEYTQNEAYAKNSYMVSMAWKNENCMYSYGISGPNAVDIVDSMDIFSSERIYESVFLNQCYDCKLCYYSMNLISSYFCYDCRNCHDCFMCVGLRNQEYMFLNKQYSKEEYKKILEKYKLYSYSGQEKAKKDFSKFKSEKQITNDFMINCVNCSGNSLMNSNNAKYCYTARRLHNVKYFENGNDIKDGYDMLVGGENEMCYEGITPDNDRLALFTIFSYKCSDISYCEYCFGSQDLFGCLGLRQSQYCIFNKQYTKKEYFELKEKIKEHMKKTKEYGEFFPAKYSHFEYNETIAQDNYPLSKKEVLTQNLNYFDDIQITKGRETVDNFDLPDSIDDVDESILNKILACDKTKRNFFITKQELDFYKKLRIPIPRKCFFQRHKERLENRCPRYFK